MNPPIEFTWGELVGIKRVGKLLDEGATIADSMPLSAEAILGIE